MRKIPLELQSISPGMQRSSGARDMEHTKTSFLMKKIQNLMLQVENIPKTAGAVPWHPRPCVRVGLAASPSLWDPADPEGFGGKQHSDRAQLVVSAGPGEQSWMVREGDGGKMQGGAGRSTGAAPSPPCQGLRRAAPAVLIPGETGSVSG